MKKYIAMIDWKVEFKNGFDYVELDAENAVEAIEKADDLWNENVYLIKIMEKAGKINRYEGFKVTTYTSILCRRSFGWHRTNTENGESEVTVKQYINKYFTTYEIQ